MFVIHLSLLFILFIKSFLNHVVDLPTSHFLVTYPFDYTSVAASDFESFYLKDSGDKLAQFVYLTQNFTIAEKLARMSSTHFKLRKYICQI